MIIGRELFVESLSYFTVTINKKRPQRGMLNMNTAIANTITAAGSKAQYDACAKRLIGQKIILAHILVRTVDEFKGMKPEEVVLLIEGAPQIGTVPVNPGMTNMQNTDNSNTDASQNITDTIDASDISRLTNTQVGGLNTEDSEINEGTIRFDIIFYVRMRDGLAQMIINVEIQKDQPKDYHLLNRSIYYVSRMVSSQKNRDFEHSNYDDLKPVFSIWICLNMDENSLTRYYLSNENILGTPHWKGKQDLLNIVLIGITREVLQQDDKYELHRLLGTLLSDKLSINTKFEIMKNEYHIPLNDDFRKDVNIMCNLGEGIEERAIRETTERVTKEVTKSVIKEMTEQFILSMYKKGYSLEQISDIIDKSTTEIEEIVNTAVLSV